MVRVAAGDLRTGGLQDFVTRRGRARLHLGLKQETFAEAGPRANLRAPNEQLKNSNSFSSRRMHSKIKRSNSWGGKVRPKPSKL